MVFAGTSLISAMYNKRIEYQRRKYAFVQHYPSMFKKYIFFSVHECWDLPRLIMRMMQLHPPFIWHKGEGGKMNGRGKGLEATAPVPVTVQS